MSSTILVFHPATSRFSRSTPRSLAGSTLFNLPSLHGQFPCLQASIPQEDERSKTMKEQSTIRALKQSFRKDMRKKLSLIPSHVVAHESQTVTRRLLAMKEYQSSRNISIYISMPTGEISTRDIIKHALGDGKNCFVPRCDGDNMEMVRLKSWEDFTSLPLNSWKIPEPPLDEPREKALDRQGLDLIVMPGLAFDVGGWRLGHGKGYYDRYLERAAEWVQGRGCNPPVTVALALSEQIVETSVPRDRFDQRPDYLLTPTDIIQHCP